MENLNFFCAIMIFIRQIAHCTRHVYWNEYTCFQYWFFAVCLHFFCWFSCLFTIYLKNCRHSCTDLKLHPNFTSMHTTPTFFQSFLPNRVVKKHTTYSSGCIPNQPSPPHKYYLLFASVLHLDNIKIYFYSKYKSLVYFTLICTFDEKCNLKMNLSTNNNILICDLHSFSWVSQEEILVNQLDLDLEPWA